MMNKMSLDPYKNPYLPPTFKEPLKNHFRILDKSWKNLSFPKSVQECGTLEQNQK